MSVTKAVVSEDKPVAVRVASARDAITESVGDATTRDDSSCEDCTSPTLCRPPLLLVEVVVVRAVVVEVVVVGIVEVGVVVVEVVEVGVVVAGINAAGVVVVRVFVVGAVEAAVVVKVVGRFQPCRNEQLGLSGSGGGDLAETVSVGC